MWNISICVINDVTIQLLIIEYKFLSDSVLFVGYLYHPYSKYGMNMNRNK